MRVDAVFDHAKALLQVDLPESFPEFEKCVSAPHCIYQDVQPALFLLDLREQLLDRARARVVDHHRDAYSSPHGHSLRRLFNRLETVAQVKPRIAPRARLPGRSPHKPRASPRAVDGRSSFSQGYGDSPAGSSARNFHNCDFFAQPRWYVRGGHGASSGVSNPVGKIGSYRSTL